MANIVILGATSAIAEQFARLYAGQENQLILVARDESKLSEIAIDLKLRGAKSSESIVFDFSRLDQLEALVSQIYNIVEVVDILLLAYGTLPEQDKCNSMPDYSRYAFSLNGSSPILLLSLFAEKLRDNNAGTIVAISSVAGDRGRQSNYLYGSAKSALSTYLSGLRNYLSGNNVNVITIKPGFVKTPMTKDFKKGFLWVGPEKVAADIKKAIVRQKNIVYTPWYWYWIMLIIKHIPEFIFKKMKL